MLRDGKKLVAKVNYLKFGNKKLLKVFKDKRKKKNCYPTLNLLGKKDNSL